jgi:tetratricopeptide (TPR) repeat protein
MNNTLRNHTRLELEKATVKISTTSGFKGTGFFISPDGYILTAWHCIAEIIPMPFSTISVETIDGKTFDAQLDKEKSIPDSDIAVLKINSTTDYCVPLGLVIEEHKGSEVMAVGYAAGYIEGRGMGVYEGIINQFVGTDKIEVPAIQGSGQSGGLVYHFATQRVIGIAIEVYHGTVLNNEGLAVRLEALFDNWRDLDSINHKVADVWDERMADVPKPLEVAELGAMLAQVPDRVEDLPDLAETGWPFPIHLALERLSESEQRYVQDYLNAFEAFIHFHFVTLASQFYWALPTDNSARLSDELRAGLSVLHESLFDPACGGGATWLRRSAVLSLACTQLESMPLPPLADILEPATLVLDKCANTNPDTQQENPDFWFIREGGRWWTFLTALAEVRTRLERFERLDLNSVEDDAIEEPLERWLNTLGVIFAPYQGLQLALVSETPLPDSQQRPVGIHCYWSDRGKFLSVSNIRNRKQMAKIWELLKGGELNLLRAPAVPRPLWQWDESLLLYQSAQPYQEYLYLMPLGFRYRHAAAGDRWLPGLLDSVRWKQKRVASVIQRTYQESELPSVAWQLQKTDAELARAPLSGRIEQLVAELCQNFKFEIPTTDTQPVVIPPQFDLQHDRIAEQLADNTVARPLEMDRVLSLLKQSQSQRLLLEGQSGTGKSVLLAQLFLAERERAVFISMDAKPEPLAEAQEMGQSQSGLQQKTSNAAEPQPGPEQDGNVLTEDKEMAVSSARADQPKASVALRVGMYCLTVLNPLMELPRPTDILPLPKLQDALRANLADFAQRHPQAYFIVIVDGANQAPDPGGLLGGLPDPLPSNLYVLVSSQPQQRVRQPLTLYGHQQWAFADIAQLAPAEAEAMVWHYWTVGLAGQPTPKRAELSARLLQRVCEASQNVPIFLEDWTRRLRAYWADHQPTFATEAEAYFEQHYATALPEFLRVRLEAVKQPFEPAQLLEAVLWCLSLIQKSLTVETLLDAIQALRQHGPFAELPAISKSQLEDGLSALGGFLRRLHRGFEEQWQLSHEVLGQWFSEQHGQAESLPSLRLSLVPFGAIALPNNASEAEFVQWLEWVKAKDYEHYESLAPELQVSVLESLLAHLPENKSDRAFVLARLGLVFLYGTGEQQRGFALESALQQALQHHLSVRTRAEVLQTLGDIKNKLNQLDTAKQYFERSVDLSEQLLSESATPQNRRDVSVTLERIGDIYVSQNDLSKAKEYFERDLKLSEQLLSESATPQNRRDVSISFNRLGKLYQSQNDLSKAKEYFERDLKLSEQLLSESATPQNRRDVAVVFVRLGDLYQSQNDLDTAKQYFERSWSFFKQLSEESPIPQIVNEMQIVSDRLEAVRRELG